MQRKARRVARLTLFGLIAAVGVLFVGSGVALGQPGPGVDQNHFRCYIISQQTPQAAQAITLDDQFTTEPEAQPVLVGEPVMFCPPTEKSIGGEVVGPIEDEEEHYALYPAPGPAVPRTVLVTDQFGTDVPWQITTPKYVMVPTAKTIVIEGEEVTFDDRENMNHYWCYEATGPRVGARGTLDDQFNGPDNVRVTTPKLFCAPAEKVHNEVEFPILDEETHLACYEIHGKQKTQQFTVGALNQFEDDQWQTGPWEILCAPATKALPAD
jgi:hypothetical protein